MRESIIIWDQQHLTLPEAFPAAVLAEVLQDGPITFRNGRGQLGPRQADRRAHLPRQLGAWLQWR